MTSALTVSNEVISVSNKRLLGSLLLEVITRIKEDLSGPKRTCKDSDLNDIMTIVKAQTGIVITSVTIRPREMANAGAIVFTMGGHATSDYSFTKGNLWGFKGEDVDKVIFNTVIDLDNAKIKGPITQHLTTKLVFNEGLFNGDVNLTPEEITAITLHEIGHMFNVFLTLGDYVWLNYYLSDGVDIVLGKKPNKYKLEILTPRGLEAAIKDPKDREEFKKDPTKANTRRALLTAFRMKPRHYLHSKELNTTIRRDEQLADLFASRMGFGRAFVTGNDKLDRYYGSHYIQSKSSFLMTEAFKTVSTIIGVGLLPIYGLGLIWLVVASNFYAHDVNTHPRYDNPTERANKIRRDLIAQLKAFSNDPHMRQSLNDDIKAIDILLNDYHQKRTLWMVLTQVFSTDKRRQWQAKQQEEVLESLLHNDLFVATQRFDQLNQSRV